MAIGHFSQLTKSGKEYSHNDIALAPKGANLGLAYYFRPRPEFGSQGASVDDLIQLIASVSNPAVPGLEQ